MKKSILTCTNMTARVKLACDTRHSASYFLKFFQVFYSGTEKVHRRPAVVVVGAACSFQLVQNRRDIIESHPKDEAAARRESHGRPLRALGQTLDTLDPDRDTARRDPGLDGIGKRFRAALRT